MTSLWLCPFGGRRIWTTGVLALAVVATIAVPPAGDPPNVHPDRGFSRLPADLRPAVFQALNLRGGPAYAIQTAGDRFEAVNGAHGFGVVFNAEGVRIAPAVSTDAPLVMQLARFGGQDAVAAVSMGPWSVDGRRAERSSTPDQAPLTEWYINGPAGLEQGFTVPAPPAEDSTLALDLRVNDAWRVRANDSGESIRLIERQTGTELSYNGLIAFDTRGRRLPAAMTATDDGLTITVDTAGAVYPVTIDPFIQQQKLTTPAAADNFGIAVALSGDTVLVGASATMVSGRTQGLAFVFVRSGSLWTQQAELGPADGATVQQFGVSVGLSGNTAVVGAPSEDVGGQTNQGAAYVFVRTGTAWSQQQRLLATDGKVDDDFGRSVSIDGNTIAIGASQSDVGANSEQGAAYIFERVGTTWSQQQKLVAADGARDDNFGISISLNANTVIVGAFVDDIGTNVDQGSAYVFTRTNGTWSLQQKLVASDGQSNDGFGLSVAVNGDRAFVGAPTDDIGGFIDRGSVVIFARSGSVWTFEQQIAASDGRTSDRFGQHVAASGNVAVVGAPIHDDGVAYVFRRGASGWTQGETLAPADRTSRFSPAAIDGTIIAVGSPEFGRVLGPGSAYVFVDQPVGTPPPPPVGPPPPPVVDAPNVTSSTVRITWGAVTGATRYQLRAGTSPGGNNAFDGDVGNTTSLTAVNVPNGSYFVRVHSANALGESAPSNEVRVDVGGVVGPCVVPANPSGLFATISGSLVTLTWVSVPGPTSYVVEAGSVSGAANLAVIDTGSVSPILMATAPRGTYFVRVRARNACGASGPSNQVVVVVN